MSAPGSADRIPAVLYAAKSTADLKGSIETQLADGRALAEREGVEVLAEYRDEAASAYSGDRGPKLVAAREHAERLAAERGTAALIVQHSDRLARGDGKRAAHLVEYALWALKSDVKIRSVQDPQTFEDLLYAVVTGQRNHEDSQRKAAATRDGKRRAFERGEHGGGPVQDGYAALAEVEGGRPVRRIVEDPTRAPIIRRIFELAEAGVADASIARRLNREGERTLAGRSWTRRRVQDTVTNAVYAGFVVWHRGRPDEQRRPGAHPALVEADVFERIQGLRAARDRAVGSDRTPGRPNSRHVLAGLAVCARCGAKMRPRVSTYKRKTGPNAGTRARYYLCAHQAESDGLCDAPQVDAEVVDAAFIRHLESFFVDFDGWLANVTRERATDRATVEKSIRAERGRLADVNRQRDALADRYAVLLDSGDEVEARACAHAMERRREEAAQVEHRLRELEATLDALGDEDDVPVDAMLDFYNRLSEAVRGRLAQDEVAEVNRGLREVLDRVELDACELSLGPCISVWPVLRDEVAAIAGAFEEPALIEGPQPPIVPPLERVTARPEQNERSAQA